MKILNNFKESNSTGKGLIGIRDKFFKKPYVVLDKSFDSKEIYYNRLNEMAKESYSVHGGGTVKYSISMLEKKVKDSYKKDEYLFTSLIHDLKGEEISEEEILELDEKYAPKVKKEVNISNSVLKEELYKNIDYITKDKDIKNLKKISLLLKNKGIKNRVVESMGCIEYKIGYREYILGELGIVDKETNLILYNKRKYTIKVSREEYIKELQRLHIITDDIESDELKKIIYVGNLLSKNYVKSEYKKIFDKVEDIGLK